METVLVNEEECALKNENAETEQQYILFVCTGNTCRSPMAAALWNACYGENKCHAFSAGLAADGSGISPNAAAALLQKGIHSVEGENDYLSHISHTVTAEDIQKADIVYGITQRHAMQLLFSFPQYAAKISALPKNISDPYGGDLDVYEKCLADIEEAFSMLYGCDGDKCNE